VIPGNEKLSAECLIFLVAFLVILFNRGGFWKIERYRLYKGANGIPNGLNSCIYVVIINASMLAQWLVALPRRNQKLNIHRANWL